MGTFDNRRSAQQLAAASPESQSTYIGQYITAYTTIAGEDRNETSTTFASAAGQFQPNIAIILNPQNLKQEGMEYRAGAQKLKVNLIMLVPPSVEQEGSVFLDASFTDIYGNGDYSFVGPIAAWTLTGAS